MHTTRNSDLVWHKVRACTGTANCVEVAVLPHGGTAIRDSKDPQGSILMFDAAEWAAFVAAVKAGEFDPSPAERR